MNLCKDCKHWDHRHSYRKNEAAAEPSHQACLRINKKSRDAFVFTIESYASATVFTAPEFGCSSWDPK